MVPIYLKFPRKIAIYFLAPFLQCFPDKALQQELTKLVLRCGNKDCSWKGLLNSYKVLGKICFVYRCISHACGAPPC